MNTLNTQTELTRIQTARNKLRTKGVELGINTNTDKLDVIATAFEGVENRGAVSAQVQEGDTYTIPKGYHNGSGTVSGVKGGGNYSLQSKKATPTKKQQNITPDSGYYGLSDVTVDPIPDNFQDVSPVTAGAADVLANKVIVAADGSTVAGTMPNNGSVTPDVLPAGKSYTIPKGYHDGTGKVTALNLWDQTDGNAISDEMLEGVTAWVKGFKITGTMPNRGNVNQVLDTETPSFKIPWGAHYGNGTISISLEEKEVTPTYEAQTITPASGNVLSKVVVAGVSDDLQDVSGVTAGAEDVLAGEVIVDAEGNEITGTMPNIGAQTASVNAGGSVTISKGYHDGTGKITGNSLASQTPGDAAAANILTGKKAWVEGSQVTGTMPNNGAVAPTALAAGGSYTIPAGYHNGSGKVTAASLASQTAGTAAAAEILSGETAWVGGAKVTGSMTNNGAKSLTIDGLTVTSVAIPAGYHNGSGTVSLTSDIEEALAAI